MEAATIKYFEEQIVKLDEKIVWEQNGSRPCQMTLRELRGKRDRMLRILANNC